MTPGEILVTGAMVAAFASIHLNVRRLRFLQRTPRSRWLSFCGGVSVAYVFLHILPDLGAHSTDLAREFVTEPVVAESIVYSLALAGLAGFYGLERKVKLSRERSREEGEGDRVKDNVLWLHVASYATLNLLIGYLLVHREEAGPWALGLYFSAIGLHFLTADFGMRQHHPEPYDRWGGPVLAAAVVAGWGLGLFITLPSAAIAGLFAFLAGNIVLGVLKEELPDERQSFFLPFAGGVVGFAALILAERLWA